ncbi:hypothetical protein H2203_008618 [Taxawa tesnikishii (nom. ined.)]|nr:hypothetical protein H2203_008618 [Dothideales sp. JES 119]
MSAPLPQPKIPNYDDGIDFEALAIQDADFARVYRAANGHVDFQDPKALQQLTKSVLKRDFGLTISLPYDRLCPPVPVRYNYIRWIQDLLDTTSNSYTDKYDPTRKVIGLDVGTGASAIYALLACASRPAWLMYGTDIDSRSLFSAQKRRFQQASRADPAPAQHVRRSTAST